MEHNTPKTGTGWLIAGIVGLTIAAFLLGRLTWGPLVHEKPKESRVGVESLSSDEPHEHFTLDDGTTKPLVLFDWGDLGPQEPYLAMGYVMEDVSRDWHFYGADNFIIHMDNDTTTVSLTVLIRMIQGKE